MRAKEKGCKIVVADPRHIETARIADLYLPIKNGCNVAFLNAFANCLVNDGPLRQRNSSPSIRTAFDEWWGDHQRTTLESVQDITGVEPALITKLPRCTPRRSPLPSLAGAWAYASRSRTEDGAHHRLHRLRCRARSDKPNSGLAPVRGQNNVQGSCDMGMLPNLVPLATRKSPTPQCVPSLPRQGVPGKLPLEEGYKLTDLGHLVDEGQGTLLLQLRRGPGSDRARFGR